MEAPPEREPKRWTVKEAYAWLELFPEARFELIEGKVYERMAHSPEHAGGVRRLTRWAIRVFGDESISSQLPLSMIGRDAETSEPEPDIVVVKPGDYDSRHPRPDEVLLVVEITYTSHKMDLETKAALYGRNGIVEYWALDLQSRRLIVHREPSEKGYGVITILDESRSIAPLAAPEHSVTVASLLP
ncbi:MAG: Uma2 family endonuclease [Bryobacteraceae bacterium]|nr:Uma2 family endonuclease [Bryobacteraceae bacterium]